MTETISISGEQITIKNTNLKVNEVLFYTENPRVYAHIKPYLDKGFSESELQDKIFNIMIARNHVKELKKTIQKDGGLINAIIVSKINNKFYAIEGNSRLACYKSLLKTSTHWKEIKCIVTKRELNKDEMFYLQTAEHIVGKTQWSTYEKSNLLYRKHYGDSLQIEELAEIVGISEQEVKSCIKTIELMDEVEDAKQSHYSHYYVAVKSQTLKKKMSDDNPFRRKLVTCIKNEEIEAQDIRDKLSKVTKDPEQTEKWVTSKISLDTAFDKYVDAGGTDSVVNKTQTFLNLIQTRTHANKIVRMEGTKKIRLTRLLRQIHRELVKLRRRMGDEDLQRDLEDL